MMDAAAIRRLVGPPTAAGVRRTPDLCPNTMAYLDDRALAEQFAAGQSAAVEQLIDQHQADVSRLVARVLAWADHATVDDLVQDVFVRAIESRRQFKSNAALKTWLTRIAINTCRAHQRKQNRRGLLLRLWHAGRASTNQTTNAHPTEQAELADQVRAAVAQLPASYREVVVLFYLEELTLAEVGDVLGLKPAAVATRLSRAREKLRSLLDATLIET